MKISYERRYFKVLFLEKKAKYLMLENNLFQMGSIIVNIYINTYTNGVYICYKYIRVMQKIATISNFTGHPLIWFILV